MARIAINGLGRIGKLTLRALFRAGMGNQVVLLNDPAGDVGQHALWFEFDSVHGRWDAAITHSDRDISVNGHAMRLTSETSPTSLPLAELEVDFVIDCTGIYKTPARLAPFFEASVRKVLVSAPIMDDSALNLVYGVNHHLYDPDQHHLLTGASCTTNCLAPIVMVLQEEIGIRHGSITTIHDVTNSQPMVDKPMKDSRRARSGLVNLIPTTTGSARAITLIYPELTGRLNGHAVRVPLLNASITDCVFELEHEVTVEQVNALFRKYADGPLKGILGYEERPLVSTDYRGDPRSSIIDAQSTMVVNGTQLKVYAWYDNEWGYACRMADIAGLVSEAM